MVEVIDEEEEPGGLADGEDSSWVEGGSGDW